LQKYNQTQWYLQVNQSKNSTDGLDLGTYTYQAFAGDVSGGINSTEIRSVTITSGGITPGNNNWICSTTQSFSNASCWSLGHVPIALENVTFNSTGTGDCNITNNTMPQSLGSFTVASGYTGTIYFNPLFAVGNWTGRNDGTQLWNVTNNINISSGTEYIYGDYLHSTFTGIQGNITSDGHGQEWNSVSGNITIGTNAVLNGVGLGFAGTFGPGFTGGPGIYGGKHQGYQTDPYGNATAPISLGSGGDGGDSKGGSGIKLQAANSIIVNGNILMSANPAGYQYGGAGGSIWLKANNISGTGKLSANGSFNDAGGYGGGGGRIRLEYGASLSFTGVIDISGGKSTSTSITRFSKPGTLTFTNNTWPGNWNLTGEIGLLGGNYGEGNVTNILGSFNTNGFNLSIYGDCFGNSGYYKPYVCYNSTADGRGVWINASGNITVGINSIIDGVQLGFANGTGPGYSNNVGSSYGGLGGGNSGGIYGNEQQPVSLGSGENNIGDSGGIGTSAIKLESADTVIVNGNLSFSGAFDWTPTASGGSIWLKANNISGTGTLDASGGYNTNGNQGGAGGRIALTGNIISFSGNIFNEGENITGTRGSGGTVYINATTSISSSMNISAVGYNGGNITIKDTLLTLSGIYNATGASGYNGTIIINYTDCASSFTGAIFNPNAIYQTLCGATTCTYSGSGNWLIRIEDNCTIGNNDLGANLLLVNGTCGSLTVNGTTLAKQIYRIPASYNGCFQILVKPGGTLGVKK
jgi:hypothetical protein